MKSHHNTGELRWQVVKAMLDDFPALRKKSKATSKKQKTKLNHS